MNGCVVCHMNESWDATSRQCQRERGSCPRGHFLEYPSGNCEKCYNNCAECDDDWGYCTMCTHASYTMNRFDCTCEAGQINTGNGCVERDLECRNGEYLSNDDQCLRCESNCATCDDGTGDCNSCRGSFELVAGECECPEGEDEVDGRCIVVERCPSDSYFSDLTNDCMPCSQNCAKCSNYNECEMCRDPAFELRNGYCSLIPREADCADCESSCPRGQYMDYNSRKCEDCGVNCASCDDKWGYCNQCADNTYWLNRFSYDCKCPWGYEETTPGGGCDKFECPRGSFLSYHDSENTDGTLKCTDCGANCLDCEDKWGECTECKDSTYENNYFVCTCPWGTTDDHPDVNGCHSGCGDG